MKEINPDCGGIHVIPSEIEKLQKMNEELLEAVKRSRFYVQMIWDETKGTEREGSAMGAADVLRSIDKVIEKGEKGL